MVARPSITESTIDALLAGLPRRRLRFVDYEQLVRSGSFDGERVELLFGEVVEMSPRSLVHVWLVKELGKQLTVALFGRAEVPQQSTMHAAADSAPEPDIAVYPTSEDDPHRWPEKHVLCIEVADSSRGRDLGPKAKLYALTNVTEYWVFDLVKRNVRRHRDPSDGEYRLVETIAPGQGRTLAVPGFADVEIAIDPLFERIP